MEVAQSVFRGAPPSVFPPLAMSSRLPVEQWGPPRIRCCRPRRDTSESAAEVSEFPATRTASGEVRAQTGALAASEHLGGHRRGVEHGVREGILFEAGADEVADGADSPARPEPLVPSPVVLGAARADCGQDSPSPDDTVLRMGSLWSVNYRPCRGDRGRLPSVISVEGCQNSRVDSGTVPVA